MIVQVDRLKLRLAILDEQMKAREGLMCKLKDKIQKGYVPSDAKEFADVLRMVQEYGRLVGRHEDCQEIIDRLAEAPMEKFGVECQNDHSPSKSYMEKQAAGGYACRHCGKHFDEVKVADQTGVKAELKGGGQARQDAKGAIDKIFGV